MVRDTISPYGGAGAFPERAYSYGGGVDKNFSSHILAGTAPKNLLRSSAFESWSQGVSGRPDCFDHNSVGTIAQVTTPRYWGSYACRISKVNTDGAVTRLYQKVKQYPTTTAAANGEKVFTFSVWLKTDEGSDTVRPYYYDGTNYKYGPYYTGGNDWQECWLSFVVNSSATVIEVGIEVEETASAINVFWYTDCWQLVWGPAAYIWGEGAEDRSLICQDWMDDGTHVDVRGAMRAIPFYVDGTTTGGAVNELAHSYVLSYGCSQIVHVSTNLFAYGALQERHVTWANNYSTTGFDIYIGRTDARVMTAQAWEIDGLIICIGWDDRVEQFK
jgi:hypothetical protein